MILITATIVNLPWALLVEGDVIVLRPGQEVPGHCRGLQPDDPELFFGQIFQPSAPVINILICLQSDIYHSFTLHMFKGKCSPCPCGVGSRMQSVTTSIHP